MLASALEGSFRNAMTGRHIASRINHTRSTPPVALGLTSLPRSLPMRPGDCTPERMISTSSPLAKPRNRHGGGDLGADGRIAVVWAGRGAGSVRCDAARQGDQRRTGGAAGTPGPGTARAWCVRGNSSGLSPSANLKSCVPSQNRQRSRERLPL